MLKLWLDIGHGGDDLGCTWPPRSDFIGAEAIEAEIVYTIGVRVYDALESESVQVELSRGPMDNPTLEDSAEDAHAAGADMAIAIHCDSYSTDKPHGARAFILNGESPMYGPACEVLNAMPHPLRYRKTPTIATESTWPRVRNVLLPYERYRIPCMLLECGYLSNPQDRQALKNNIIHRAIAASIWCGVERYHYLRKGHGNG